MKMVKKISWLVSILTVLSLSSCSWEDLPAYDDANIEGVQFYYRYASPTDKDPITGEPMIRNVQLGTSNVDINSDAGTVTLTVSATNQQASFPDNVYSAIALNNLVCSVTLSTAARITKADNHKDLGLPDDWTSPHSFVVMAANGNTKNWTITVTGLTK